MTMAEEYDYVLTPVSLCQTGGQIDGHPPRAEPGPRESGMARCNCGSTACSCTLTAPEDSGIEIIGRGSPNSPYEISLAPNHPIYIDALVRAIFAATRSTTEHAATFYQKGVSGADVSAVNIVSDNPDGSTVMISGIEKNRGTVKISHRKPAGVSDASAAALSIDLQDGAGNGDSGAQGVFITATEGPTTGNLVTIRNAAAPTIEELVLKATGRLGLGVAVGATPAGMVDVRQYADSVKGYTAKARSTAAAALLEFQNSVAAVIANISKDGDLYAAGNALGQANPADHNLIAWAYDPALAINGQLVTNGTVYLVKVHVPVGASATKVYWHVSTVGVTAVAGQNHVGLYSLAGTRLATTGVDADVTSTGLKTTTIASQALATGGDYWVALVFNAATAPTLARSNGLTGAGGLINVGLSPAAYRFATAGTGQTALPASITPGSNAQGLALWAGIGP